MVAPGTLLGLFPGVINDRIIPRPPTPKRGLRPYLLREDGVWIDYESEIPYPIYYFGENINEYIENIQIQIELRGMKYDSILTKIRAEKLNPYALGHIVNHPPPDTPANIKLIDFDMPITFFPSYMSRYFPSIKRHEDHAFTRK
jgi:hypothetical protein